MQSHDHWSPIIFEMPRMTLWLGIQLFGLSKAEAGAKAEGQILAKFRGRYPMLQHTYLEISDHFKEALRPNPMSFHLQ